MKESKVQRKINRSKTYLLPLLNNYINLTSTIIINLYNTYIYCEDQSDTNYFYLTFLLTNIPEVVLKNIKIHLEDSILYKETIIDNNIIIFKFKFPDEHIQDYK